MLDICFESWETARLSSSSVYVRHMLRGLKRGVIFRLGESSSGVKRMCSAYAMTSRGVKTGSAEHMQALTPAEKFFTPPDLIPGHHPRPDGG